MQGFKIICFSALLSVVLIVPVFSGDPLNKESNNVILGEKALDFVSNPLAQQLAQPKGASKKIKLRRKLIKVKRSEVNEGSHSQQLSVENYSQQQQQHGQNEQLLDQTYEYDQSRNFPNSQSFEHQQESIGVDRMGMPQSYDNVAQSSNQFQQQTMPLPPLASQTTNNNNNNWPQNGNQHNNYPQQNTDTVTQTFHFNLDSRDDDYANQRNELATGNEIMESAQYQDRQYLPTQGSNFPEQISHLPISQPPLLNQNQYLQQYPMPTQQFQSSVPPLPTQQFNSQVLQSRESYSVSPDPLPQETHYDAIPQQSTNPGTQSEELQKKNLQFVIELDSGRNTNQGGNKQPASNQGWNRGPPQQNGGNNNNNPPNNNNFRNQPPQNNQWNQPQQNNIRNQAPPQNNFRNPQKIQNNVQNQVPQNNGWNQAQQNNFRNQGPENNGQNNQAPQNIVRNQGPPNNGWNQGSQNATSGLHPKPNHGNNDNNGWSDVFDDNALIEEGWSPGGWDSGWENDVTLWQKEENVAKIVADVAWKVVTSYVFVYLFNAIIGLMGKFLGYSDSYLETKITLGEEAKHPFEHYANGGGGKGESSHNGFHTAPALQYHPKYQYPPHHASPHGQMDKKAVKYAQKAAKKYAKKAMKYGLKPKPIIPYIPDHSSGWGRYEEIDVKEDRLGKFPEEKMNEKKNKHSKGDSEEEEEEESDKEELTNTIASSTPETTTSVKPSDTSTISVVLSQNEMSSTVSSTNPSTTLVESAETTFVPLTSFSLINMTTAKPFESTNKTTSLGSSSSPTTTTTTTTTTEIPNTTKLSTTSAIPPTTPMFTGMRYAFSSISTTAKTITASTSLPTPNTTTTIKPTIKSSTYKPTYVTPKGITRFVQGPSFLSNSNSTKSTTKLSSTTVPTSTTSTKSSTWLAQRYSFSSTTTTKPPPSTSTKKPIITTPFAFISSTRFAQRFSPTTLKSTTPSTLKTTTLKSPAVIITSELSSQPQVLVRNKNKSRVLFK